jgi:two-component system NtrC family response regulator
VSGVAGGGGGGGARILLVEDEAAQRRLLAGLLRGVGYTVAEAGDVAAARAELARAPVDLVLTDWQLPDGDGLGLLRELRAAAAGTGGTGEGRDLALVMVTAYGTIAHAVQAIRAGADDYLAKPFERDALLLTLERALAKRRLESENRRLTAALGERDRLVDLVGRAPAMQALFRRVERVAGTAAAVLLTGESGTGKELAARALHALSRRADGPFVALNCAAVPEGLFEAELFGAEKGAYTGADRSRSGKFEAAAGGTLFLDEIGELPLQIQPKLLRALQEGQVVRVGGHREISTDVRIVAATNRDLAGEAAAGRFREDLFYRLNVVPIRLPPLRERREDIPLLIEHLTARAARRHGLPLCRFPAPVMRRLLDHAWPGNVRELANVVERLLLLAEGDAWSDEDLPAELKSEAPAESGFALPPAGISWERHERDLLRQALELAGGNRARAARLLDLPYKAFLYRLQKHGLAVPDVV